MELNLFKHHYFVIVSLRWMYNKKACIFIHCRAKDVEKTILSKLPEDAREVCIERITKLD